MGNERDVMTEKEFKKRLKKIKKKWPQHIMPVFLKSGEIRIVRTVSIDELTSRGIKNIEGLSAKTKMLENKLTTPGEIKLIEEFVSLVQNQPDSLSASVTFPIFEKYFPGILDELK